MQYIYDRSHSLGIALVAAGDLSGARYVPLDQAPAHWSEIDPVYLRQLHAVANSEAVGLVVMRRRPFSPEQWERS